MNNLLEHAKNMNEPENIEDACIFYANTEEAVTIKSLCEFLNTNLSTIGEFKFGTKRITLKGTDKEENCLIDFYLEKKNFNKYHCSEELIRGVPLANFYSMFKSIKKKDRVSIWITKDDKTTIRSRIYNADKERNSVSFTPTTSDIKNDRKLELCPKYNEPVSIQANELQRMCRDLQPYKTIEAICYQGGIIFSANDGELIGKSFIYGEPYKEKANMNIFKKIYDTQLFCKMAKLYSFSKRIHIFTYEEVPMKINANIGNLGEMNIFIRNENEKEL